MGAPGTPLGPALEIPGFTISGVLPPFLGATPAIPANMSPFPTTLSQIAGKLCYSQERRRILRGFLEYRRSLSAIGFDNGFQWLSGSFLEDIELIEKRHPRDIDVVTFFRRPPSSAEDSVWNELVETNLGLLNPVAAKATFKCDAYFVDLNTDALSVVGQTRYWFGLFSHRRGGLWKGMLQIPLAVTADDANASALIEE